MFFRPTTTSSLSTAVLFFGFASRLVVGDKDKDDKFDADKDCQIFSDAHSPSATCNGIYKCAGGCTGYVTATNCTISQGPTDSRPPPTTEQCTLGYGQSSATMAVCINENGSFSCYGPVKGKAQCKGCVNSRQQNSNNPSPGPQPNDNSKGGPNVIPIADSNDPTKPARSSGSTIRLDVFILSLGTIMSATFL